MLPRDKHGIRFLQRFSEACDWCCNPRVVISALVAFEITFLVFTISISVDRRKQPNFSSTTSSPSEVSDLDYENETADDFLANYSMYCEKNLIPKAVNVVHRSQTLDRCPCIPNDLVGRINISNVELPLVGELELRHSELTIGGSWEPASCMARHRVAIIVPFRDREDHLRALLNLLHPMLQRQLLHYTVFVAEQAAPAVFNKASLMNAAFMIARSYANFDCYIFHDVDMLPEDDRNFYTCSSVPRHVGSHINKYRYRVPYSSIFGGVTAFRAEHFEIVNGFSNHFYGWGGEDDDMYNRIVAKELHVTRFSGSVARYTMIKHHSDVGNPSSPVRGRAFKFRPRVYVLDGLNSLRYKLVEYEHRPLYTWLYLSLPPHPAYFRGSYRALESSASACWRCAELVTCIWSVMVAIVCL